MYFERNHFMRWRFLSTTPPPRVRPSRQSNYTDYVQTLCSVLPIICMYLVRYIASSFLIFHNQVIVSGNEPIGNGAPRDGILHCMTFLFECGRGNGP